MVPLAPVVHDQREEEALERVVELVAEQVSAEPVHGKVGPVDELDSPLEFVGLNGVQAALQQGQVEFGVESVSAHVEDAGRAAELAAVLLLRQVVC